MAVFFFLNFRQKSGGGGGTGLLAPPTSTGLHTVALLRPQRIKEFVYTRLNRLVLKFFTAILDVQNVLIVA